MHPEAHAGLGWVIDQSGLDRHAPLRVLDVGGQDVNGTAHDWFTHPATTVITLDVENADIIADARTWEPDQLFDVVMATEVFEHVEDWRAVLRTMRLALDPAGPGVLLATCASDGRPVHGATGAPLPADGEWYGNVPPAELTEALSLYFPWREVRYQTPPGDAYLWGRLQTPLAITVLIPTIPGRKLQLAGALASVQAQTYQPAEVLVEEDTDREGPAAVRNRLLQRAQTDWVAFLDDDDWLLPHHLHTLVSAQLEAHNDPDVVWPWFQVEGGTDPFPQHRGRQWDPADPHQIPITVLASRQAILDVGGFRTIPEGLTDADGNRAGEDYALWLDLSAAGYRFHHTPETTWVWRHWAHNTSGLPSRVKW
jgi:hypothetical protein